MKAGAREIVEFLGKPNSTNAKDERNPRIASPWSLSRAGWHAATIGAKNYIRYTLQDSHLGTIRCGQKWGLGPDEVVEPGL